VVQQCRTKGEEGEERRGKMCAVRQGERSSDKSCRERAGVAIERARGAWDGVWISGSIPERLV
jgi:hypothetical protein